ncbi:hypothetical protein HJFPF1_13334 [Paramyrothecium foliicola]|nr:hypothetical protein HJFPF1_13334 [Paramyrothecium foliicola]
MHTTNLLLPAFTFFGIAAAAINSVTFTGSGCPPGSVGGLLSSDRLHRTMIFEDYRAFVTDPSKDCKITISFTMPSGWTGASLRSDYRGYALLASGAKAELNGLGGTFTINGPNDNDYTFPQTTPISGAAGSTQVITINSALKISGSLGPNDAGYLDSLDLAFFQA